MNDSSQKTNKETFLCSREEKTKECCLVLYLLVLVILNVVFCRVVLLLYLKSRIHPVQPPTHSTRVADEMLPQNQSSMRKGWQRRSFRISQRDGSSALEHQRNSFDLERYGRISFTQTVCSSSGTTREQPIYYVKLVS